MWLDNVFNLFCPHYPQVQLYEDFAKSRAKASVDDSISMATEEEEKPKLKATGHVFQVHVFMRLSEVLWSMSLLLKAFPASFLCGQDKKYIGPTNGKKCFVVLLEFKN